MLWLGIAVVAATFIAILRKCETRLTLILSGAVMAALGGSLSAAIDAFIGQLVNAGLVPMICTVMGFSYVMEATGCSKNLVALMAGLLKRVPFVVIPGAVLVTFIINIALPSAAGTAAAVGTLLIPMLLSMGVKPAMAASAVYLGTWGAALSPGLMFNPQVAQMAGVDVMTVIASFTAPCLAGLALTMALIAATAFVLREGVGSGAAGFVEHAVPKVNHLHAALPLVPIAVLILGSDQVALIPNLTVPQAMLLGTVLGILLTRFSPKEATKKFFRGCGDAYCDVIGVIAAAAMFCAGLDAVGLTGALIEMMEHSQAAAKFAAAFGPFVVAVISGTGNAAALAFNGTITPHAAQMGYGIVELGSMVQIGAGLGRTMSPVSPSAIICAKLAGCSAVDITKRNAVPTVLAAFLILFWLL